MEVLTLNMLKYIPALLLFIWMPSISFAHPGNTAADGCHYCRTNCDKWGEAWGERHCHGGYSDPEPSYNNSPPKPRCPSNSILIGDTCFCKEGYAVFRNFCIKIPTHAHAVTSQTDAWECDFGYVEKSSSCIPKPIPTIKALSKSSSKSSILSKGISLSSVATINKNIAPTHPAAAPPPRRGFWNSIWSIFR